MNYKEHLIACGKRMLHSGLTVEHGANISVRDPETGLIYLTPSGMPYDSITGEGIVVMRLTALLPRASASLRWSGPCILA